MIDLTSIVESAKDFVNNDITNWINEKKFQLILSTDEQEYKTEYNYLRDNYLSKIGDDTGTQIFMEKFDPNLLGVKIRDIIILNDCVYEFVYIIELKDRIVRSALGFYVHLNKEEILFVKCNMFLYHYDMFDFSEDIHPKTKYIIKNMKLSFREPSNMILGQTGTLILTVESEKSVTDYHKHIHIWESYSPFQNKLKLLY